MVLVKCREFHTSADATNATNAMTARMRPDCLPKRGPRDFAAWAAGFRCFCGRDLARVT
jgi:hypothetical protein